MHMFLECYSIDHCHCSARRASEVKVSYSFIIVVLIYSSSSMMCAPLSPMLQLLRKFEQVSLSICGFSPIVRRCVLICCIISINRFRNTYTRWSIVIATCLKLFLTPRQN